MEKPGRPSVRQVGPSEVAVGHDEMAGLLPNRGVQVDDAGEIVAPGQCRAVVLAQRQVQSFRLGRQVQVVVRRHDPRRREAGQGDERPVELGRLGALADDLVHPKANVDLRAQVPQEHVGTRQIVLGSIPPGLDCNPPSQPDERGEIRRAPHGRPGADEEHEPTLAVRGDQFLGKLDIRGYPHAQDPTTGVRNVERGTRPLGSRASVSRRCHGPPWHRHSQPRQCRDRPHPGPPAKHLRHPPGRGQHKTPSWEAPHGWPFR